MIALKPCCQQVVDTYTALFELPERPRETTALYCKDCHARIVLRDGAWAEGR